MEHVEVETNELKKEERGAGLVEYALLTAIVAAVAVIARTAVSTQASVAFSKSSSLIVAT